MTRTALAAVPAGTLLGAALATRVGIDTAQQLFNPFLGVIAEGLGTSLAAMGGLVALRSLAGLLSPWVLDLADRFGYLWSLRIALGAAAVGLVGLAAAPAATWAALAMVPLGVGLAVFVPSAQALLAMRLPFGRRASGLGTLEYGWALAGIVGMPITGLAMGTWGWRTPVGALAFLLALALATTWRVREVRDRGSRGPRGARGEEPSFFRLGHHAASAWSSVAIVALAFFAMMTVFVMHGVWLGESYAFGAERLGAVALGLGVADLLGAMVVARYADRVGKRRMLLLGAWISTAAYPLVTGVPLAWWAALLGLGVLRFALQLTYISNLAILSEQVPLQRGKVLSLGFTAGQIGLACAALAGPWLYLEFGAIALGAVAAGASLVVVAVASSTLLETPTLEEVPCPSPRSPSSP